MVVLHLEELRTARHRLHNRSAKRFAVVVLAYLPSLYNVLGVVGGRQVRARWLGLERGVRQLCGARADVCILCLRNAGPAGACLPLVEKVFDHLAVGELLCDRMMSV